MVARPQPSLGMAMDGGLMEDHGVKPVHQRRSARQRTVDPSTRSSASYDVGLNDLAQAQAQAAATAAEKEAALAQAEQAKTADEEEAPEQENADLSEATPAEPQDAGDVDVSEAADMQDADEGEDGRQCQVGSSLPPHRRVAARCRHAPISPSPPRVVGERWGAEVKRWLFPCCTQVR